MFNLNKIGNIESMSLLKSAAVVSVLTLVSRMFGYVRDMIIANKLGTGGIADAFIIAYRLPNFFRQLTAEGAVNNSFVPIFSGKLIAEGKEESSKFASMVLGWLVVIVFCLTIMMIIFMPNIMNVLALGFKSDKEKMSNVIEFGRIVFPYLLLVSIISLFSGILQSLGKFAVAAIVPALLNIGMIIALVWGSQYTETPAHALCYGILIAGVIQAVILYFSVKKNGIFVKLALPKITADTKLLSKRMLPGIIGGGVMQLNVLIDNIIGTTISSAVSYLYYADRLTQFPLALVGTALGIAMLPSLSKFVKAENYIEASKIQNRAIEVALFLIVPAALGFLLLSSELIDLMFRHGAFNYDSVKGTAATLAVLSLGLPAFVMVKVFLPSFFAAGDTKTPVKIALLCLTVNTVSALILTRFIGYLGLALSTILSSWINVACLVSKLTKDKVFIIDQELKQAALKILISAVTMIVTIVVLKYILALNLLGLSSGLLPFFNLAILLGVGGGSYLLAAYFLGSLKAIYGMWQGKA